MKNFRASYLIRSSQLIREPSSEIFRFSEHGEPQPEPEVGVIIIETVWLELSPLKQSHKFWF
jgi:hypothetical protein